MKIPHVIDIVIFLHQDKYKLEVMIDDEALETERTTRPYDSPSDAITSARHAVNGYLKGEKQ